MKELIFKLSSVFLTYKDLENSFISFKIKNRDEFLNHYFQETLYLTDKDRENIKNNNIPQPLWMRMYCRELLLNIIINNDYMEPKLKVQIYNGVKNNNPELLKLYNEYYYLAVGESCEFFTDVKEIMQYLPMQLGDYKFYLNDKGEFLIDCKGKCVGRNFFGETIKIIKHYGLEHIITVLKSPMIMEAINVIPCNNKSKIKHKRPRLKLMNI